MKAEIKFTALIIESERDWGQKVDEVKQFDTEKERDDFITEYNKGNNLPYTPDWYMYARAGEDLVIPIKEGTHGQK